MSSEIKLSQRIEDDGIEIADLTHFGQQKRNGGHLWHVSIRITGQPDVTVGPWEFMNAPGAGDRTPQIEEVFSGLLSVVSSHVNADGDLFKSWEEFGYWPKNIGEAYEKRDDFETWGELSAELLTLLGDEKFNAYLYETENDL